MILSVNSPYDITPKILQLISSISVKLGEVNANFLNRQTPQLRKQNKIKTIHSSLSIEGNTLTEDQVTAIVEGRRVIGPERDVAEVANAIEVYDALDSFDPSSKKSFLKAHKLLMKGLINDPGKYRNQGVGIIQGSKVAHVAPPYQNVPFLMDDLFKYIKNTDELALIKSCVFHYEMEFIHPFLDGNGRMGRLWQTLILKNEYPIFEFLPFETLIKNTQANYYKSLAMSDKMGKSNVFIEYMLGVIDQALNDTLNFNSRTMSDIERIEYFLHHTKREFTRKDYMSMFKGISSATASRDLQKATGMGLIKKEGEKNGTRYTVA